MATPLHMWMAGKARVLRPYLRPTERKAGRNPDHEPLSRLQSQSPRTRLVMLARDGDVDANPFVVGTRVGYREHLQDDTTTGRLDRVNLVEGEALPFGHYVSPNPTRSFGGSPVGRAFCTAEASV